MQSFCWTGPKNDGAKNNISPRQKKSAPLPLLSPSAVSAGRTVAAGAVFAQPAAFIWSPTTAGWMSAAPLALLHPGVGAVCSQPLEGSAAGV